MPYLISLEPVGMRDIGAYVEDTGCDYYFACSCVVALALDSKTAVTSLDGVDFIFHRYHTVHFRLRAHQRKQIMPAYTVGHAGEVISGWYPSRTRHTSVEEYHGTAETSKICSGVQTGRSGSYNSAIEVHANLLVFIGHTQLPQ